MPDPTLDPLVALRRQLHEHAELSGNEAATAEIVARHLAAREPDDMATGVGGHGVLAAWSGPAPGPTVLFRCELDALPIPEGNKRVSHRCGHDGHMAIVAGMADRLRARRPASGRVVLAFQPAEETGAGAARLLAAPEFARFRPDLAFALHNLPGQALGHVILREGTFASASVGLRLILTGRSAHAGEPHKGHSPALAMARIVEDLSRWIDPQWRPGTLITVVGARLGRGAFGTSPDDAEVSATLRAWTDQDLAALVAQARERCARIAQEHAEPLRSEPLRSELVEPFPATVNDGRCAAYVRDAAARAGLTVEALPHAHAWSEDFGHFASICPIALFGLGAGLQQPALHDPDHEFPDTIIAPGLAVFSEITDGVLGGSGGAQGG